jgi:hypothetical protein
MTQQHPALPPPTWANTLNSQHRHQPDGITGFWHRAEDLGYPYVEWNGGVYRTDDFAPGAQDARVCLAADLTWPDEPALPESVPHGDFTLEPYILAVAPSVYWRVRNVDDGIVITGCSSESHAVRMLNNRLNRETQ